jgi:hypothetical protein
MSKKKLAAIIVPCVIAIIVVIALIIFHPWRPPISPLMYSLSVDVSPSGAGSVSPSGGAYGPSVQVTLTASPASGYTFDHWSGSASDNTSTITITMDSDKSLTADFKTTPIPTAPSITIALDYFGVRNTHWIYQVGGEDKAEIQLVLLIRDDQGNLATFPIPPAGVKGYYMDFFQVNALKDNMDPKIFTGTSTGSLTFSVAAYNVNKGPITKAQIDAISKWTGTDWSEIKDLVPDKELVGSCWHTWSASENLGVGSNHTLSSDDDNLEVWLRIGSNQTMPDPVPRPVLKPNVEIVGELPTGVRVKTGWVYNCYSFGFTVTNHESFGFPLYWRLESDSNPNECDFYIYRTSGEVSVPGGGSVTETYSYRFDIPGNYTWKYIAEYPEGTLVASWEGTLTVSP